MTTAVHAASLLLYGWFAAVHERLLEHVRRYELARQQRVAHAAQDERLVLVRGRRRLLLVRAGRVFFFGRAAARVIVRGRRRRRGRRGRAREPIDEPEPGFSKGPGANRTWAGAGQ